MVDTNARARFVCYRRDREVARADPGSGRHRRRHEAAPTREAEAVGLPVRPAGAVPASLSDVRKPEEPMSWYVIYANGLRFAITAGSEEAA